MTHKIQGQITLLDYKKTLKLHSKSSPFLTAVGILVRLLLVSVLLYGLVIALQKCSLFLILFDGILLMTYTYLLFFYTPKRIKQIYEQQKSLHLPFSIQISNTGIISENEVTKSEYSWALFTRWRENEYAILLYHSDLGYTPLLKRLMNQETIQFVYDQLQRNNISKK